MTGRFFRGVRYPSFDTVWPFFFFNLLLYLLFWRAGWSAVTLATIYSLTQAGYLLAWLPWLGRWREVSRADALFWGGVALFLFLPGAYLEYPADPWEHLRRALYWQDLARVAEHPLAYKQAYFFNWSFLRFFSIFGRPWAWDFLSALWQMLLAVQVYRLCNALGFDRALCRLQVLGFLFLFGTNLFGIRYYALSSTALSYFAFLECVILVARRSSIGRMVLSFPCLLLLMYWNHHWQEIAFAGICLGSLGVYRLFESVPAKFRRAGLVSLVIVFVGSLFWGAWVMRDPPEFYRQKGLIHYFSPLGTFLFWKEQRPYIQTLGVSGAISVLFAVVFIRRYRELSFLTLAPFLFFCFPPLVYVASYFIADPYATYRIFFAFPSCFLFVCLLWDFSNWVTKSRPGRVVLAAALLFAFSLPWGFPWRGRLRLQVYRPPAEVSPTARLSLVETFWPYRRELKNCLLYGDYPTVYEIATHLGMANYPVRQHPKKLMDAVEPLAEVWRRTDLFGVLIPEKSQLRPFLSEVGMISGHWDPAIGGRSWYLDERVDAFEAELKRKGWESVAVPEPYRLYLNPRRQCSPTGG